MDLVNLYFADIIFTKIEVNDTHTLYAALLNQGHNKFVIAVVPNHLAIFKTSLLKDLWYESLQTRVTTRYTNTLKSQHWRPPRGIENPLFHEFERYPDRVKYIADGHAMEMTLLNDPKKKGSYQYSKNYNFLAGLLSFHCVITFAVPARDELAIGSSIELLPRPV